MILDVEPLLYWVKERQSIADKKAAGLPPPWTEDPILQTYRFCNVRRKDDRVSQWLLKNVLTEANFNLSPKSFIEFTAFCRWVNWPPTIKHIMDCDLYPKKEIDWEKVSHTMGALKDNGFKLFTGAYMIKSAREWSGKAKHIGIVNEVIVNGLKPNVDSLLALMQGPNPTKFDVWWELNSIKYFGSFMSGQIVDDWTWTPLLSGASDINTWAPQGPGSIRGLNRLLNRPLSKRVTSTEWCDYLIYIRSEVLKLGEQFSDVTLMDVQNSLCETDKYLRVKYGEGRPRSKYRPETAY